MNNKSQKLVQYSLDNKKAEIVELNNLLEEDETCKVIVSCIYSGELGIVSITDKRLIIIRKRCLVQIFLKIFMILMILLRLFMIKDS
ncbi:hypothetical protein CYK67_07705 [Clostridium perfringens]|nr:hypothetical protein CYK67_07705 [Clostridium perfringens]